GIVMLPEFDGCAVVQARVRAHMVVVSAPLLDDHARLDSRAEPLEAQALIAQPSVEALVGAVLPRFAGIDVGDLDLGLDDPLQDRLADELRSVVGTKHGGRSTLAHEPRQHLDDSPGADAAGHVDGQALPGELVDHGQALDLLAIGAGVEDEVVGPDAVRTARRQWPWA